MSIKTIDGQIKKELTVGDAVAAAELIIRNNANAAKYRAKADALDAESATYIIEAKKQSTVGLLDSEKKLLVDSGIKSLKDFPGDDWATKGVVGENGVV